MIISTHTLSSLKGTRSEHCEALVVAVLMAFVTAAYEVVSYLLVPDFTLNWFEVIGTWSGLVCVWLARTENILTWPWGIVSAASLGYFFSIIGLPGQQWLNWGYFLIIQLWAWPQWAFGGERSSVLPVTTLTVRGRIYVMGAVVLMTLVVYVAIDYILPGSVWPVVDALVVVSSVVAQFLLGRKKVESWVLWLGPVNACSIILFWAAGAYTVMALYIAFFIHAVWALRSWSGPVTKSTGYVS